MFLLKGKKEYNSVTFLVIDCLKPYRTGYSLTTTIFDGNN